MQKLLRLLTIFLSLAQYKMINAMEEQPFLYCNETLEPEKIIVLNKPVDTIKNEDKIIITKKPGNKHPVISDEICNPGISPKSPGKSPIKFPVQNPIQKISRTRLFSDTETNIVHEESTNKKRKLTENEMVTIHALNELDEASVTAILAKSKYEKTVKKFASKLSPFVIKSKIQNGTAPTEILRVLQAHPDLDINGFTFIVQSEDRQNEISKITLVDLTALLKGYNAFKYIINERNGQISDVTLKAAQDAPRIATFLEQKGYKINRTPLTILKEDLSQKKYNSIKSKIRSQSMPLITIIDTNIN